MTFFFSFEFDSRKKERQREMMTVDKIPSHGVIQVYLLIKKKIKLNEKPI